ncbi:MAG: cyclic nucleotide-binding domain-containing protein [Polyangiaceae bacterium]|nr:cyclic nucleotide-binding domain-containing protein [Polyangiaceae bacterium]
MTELSAARSAPWPASVFDAAVLRGIDERARREIESAGAMIHRAAGDVVYRAGDAGDTFYIVADGKIALRAVKRGDDGESELRIAEAGASFGEEATIGAARGTSAIAVTKSVVAEIPVHVFRRAIGRAGKGEVAERMERALRRSATRDLLCTLALTRGLPAQSIDLLLDAIEHRSFERGEVIYDQGGAPLEVWLVAEGLVQIQTEEDERLHVRAYLSKGDFFGDVEVLEGGSRRTTAAASGPCRLLSIPAKAFRKLVEAHPDLPLSLRRLADESHVRQRAIIGQRPNETQHLFRDLYRLQVARSLLVIDLSECVRCGHCAWACEDLYGVSRLVRRGDKVVARVGQGDAPQSLLLPSSCQHCEKPACLVDCPTGAIGRDPDGEVFIREALCTGCGACAKACPWENIQMAPRAPDAPRPSGLASEYADVAVKCDECRSYESPACVSACPTGAIFRLSPSTEMADLAALFGKKKSEKAERTSSPGVWIYLVSSAIAAIPIAVVGAVMRARGVFSPGYGWGFSAGIVAALGIVGLLVYAVPKRMTRLFMKKRDGVRTETRARSRVKPQFHLHLAIGILTLGFSIAHAPPKLPAASAGSALSFSFLLTSLLGVLTAIAYFTIPERLARIERSAALPEDFRDAKKALLDRLYREISGRSELVKKVFERILLPYTLSVFGPLLLVLSGRRLREEENRLRTHIDGILEGRGGERLAGLSSLVRIVVELRALPAQRFLLRVLRAGLIAHIATFALAAALLVVHVIAAVRLRP